MPIVSFKHPELTASLRAQYQKVNDCVAGEQQVKYRAGLYLPDPSASDTSDAARDRYRAYLTRAVFYGVTARTVRGMVGQIFARSPATTLPGSLAALAVDMTGTGISFEQHAKDTSGRVVSVGRAGLFTDYSNTGGGEVTADDVRSGRVRPTITLYTEDQIINWRYRQFGSLRLLSLVVLEEKYWDEKGLFELVQRTRWRVLRIDEHGHYIQEVYTARDASKVEKIDVRDVNGNPLQRIPFEFIGSEKNDADIDPVTMYDMASLNIAHYRNSADYEESVYMLGQPTPYVTGITDQWMKTVFKDKIPLGSRAILPLPPNASAGLLQVEANSLAFEAMTHKEAQMVATGAKLVENRDVQRTATEATNDEASEQSQLSTIADNVAAAYQNAFTHASQFAGGTNEKIDISLNTEFELQTLDAATRAQLLKEWVQEAITTSEYRKNLRRAGVADLSDAEYIEEIKKDRTTYQIIKEANDPNPEPEPGNNNPQNAPANA